jgi:hypothetical protein
MTKSHSAAVESAAGRLLQGIAAERGDLLKLMNQVGLGAQEPREPSFGELSMQMAPAQLEHVSSQLESLLSESVLNDVSRRTGVSGKPLRDALAQQLHLVRMFALSDGGSFEDNLRAVEHLVRGGNVDMFAYA